MEAENEFYGIILLIYWSPFPLPSVCVQGMESVKREIDVVDDGTYRAPSQLRKRSEFSFKGGESENRVFEANEYVPFYLFITMAWYVFPFANNVCPFSHTWNY